jgi:sialic acid synthase SpsE
MAKSLVAARDLPAGHILCAGDVVRKSPSGGLAPDQLYLVVGRTLARAVHADEALTCESLR